MMKVKYLKFIISVIFGVISLFLIFMEVISSKSIRIAKITLYVPRLVADILFKCVLCPELLYFIIIFTFVFYALIGFIIGLFIEKIKKK